MSKVFVTYALARFQILAAPQRSRGYFTEAYHNEFPFEVVFMADWNTRQTRCASCDLSFHGRLYAQQIWLSCKKNVLRSLAWNLAGTKRIKSKFLRGLIGALFLFCLREAWNS